MDNIPLSVRALDATDLLRILHADDQRARQLHERKPSSWTFAASRSRQARPFALIAASAAGALAGSVALCSAALVWQPSQTQVDEPVALQAHRAVAQMVIDARTHEPLRVRQEIEAAGLQVSMPLEAQAVGLPSFAIEKMSVSDAYLEALKQSEGLRLQAYQDQGAVWTIGYGRTGVLPDGRAVAEGLTITREMAEALLIMDVDHAASFVRQLVKVPITQSQFDALTDFVFNKGAARFRQSSLLSTLNKADYLGTAEWFMAYTKIKTPNGVIESKGLKNRALENRETFLYELSGASIELLERVRLAGKRVHTQLQKASTKLARARTTRSTPLPDALEQALAHIDDAKSIIADKLRHQAGTLSSLKRQHEVLFARYWHELESGAIERAQSTAAEARVVASSMEFVRKASDENRSLLARYKDAQHLLAMSSEVISLAAQGLSVSEDQWRELSQSWQRQITKSTADGPGVFFQSRLAQRTWQTLGALEKQLFTDHRPGDTRLAMR